MRFSLNITVIILVQLISNSLCCQNSFELYFSTNEHEYFKNIYHDKEDNFIGVLSKKSPIEFYMKIDSLFGFDNYGNFEYWDVNLVRPDTIINVKNLIRDSYDNYYLSLLGLYYINGDSVINYFDGLMKFDEEKNFVWEKFYNRPPEADSLGGIIYFSSMMELDNKNEIMYVGSLTKINENISKFYFIDFNKEGDTLYTKLLPQYYGAQVLSFTYNYDSSKYLLHKNWGKYPDCNPVFDYHDGALLLDTNQLNVETGICYTNGVWNSLNVLFDAKLTSDGNLIVAGQSKPYPAESFPLSVFKYDTSLNLVKTATLTNPDSSFYPGWLDNIDINSDDEIFVAGAFDRALGSFTSHYCKIYVAKLDTELNVLSERYLGGDASYDVYSMIATPDGGCAIGGFKYDYKVNGDEEGDAFIIKTDPDLWVDIEENNTIPIHSVLCYPNPGNDKLNIRTTTYNSSFMLFDDYGRLILTKEINNLITEINTYNLKRGVYFWKLFKDNTLVDRGKWIKK